MGSPTLDTPDYQGANIAGASFLPAGGAFSWNGFQVITLVPAAPGFKYLVFQIVVLTNQTVVTSQIQIEGSDSTYLYQYLTPLNKNTQVTVNMGGIQLAANVGIQARNMDNVVCGSDTINILYVKQPA